ncbi:MULTISPECIES: hypothetical protein [unclassified Agrococcus]|uniref:hypothetical protein n=1 Tax=unclassified Agrococcus TaxID=2615065 RepID=UPI00361B557B
MTKPAILSSITGDSARARRTDMVTSHAAADSISSQALEDREREVFAILDEAGRPLTDQEIEQIHDERVRLLGPDFRHSPSGLRTARKQLTEGGVIEQDGWSRTLSKRDAATWRIAVVAAATLRVRIDKAIEIRLARAAKERAERNHGTTRAA